MRSSMEARPLSVVYHIDADSFYIYISTQETKQPSKFQSDPSSNCFTIDVFNNKMMNSSIYFLTFLLLFVSHFTQVL